MSDGRRAAGAPPLVARPDLIGRACAGRIVVLGAPGGYGKTTLAQQVVHVLGRATVRAVLDRTADPATVLDELRRGLRSAGLTDTAALADRAPSLDGVFAAFAERREPTAVFIDEVQRLDDAAARELARALRGTPPHLLVILAGRRIPAALGAIDGPGVVRFGADELRFGAATTAQVLPDDSSSIADWVTAVTDGWPAAIGLVAQLLRAGAPTERVLARAGALGAELDSLVAHLAADLPAELADALPTIASVPVLDAALIDEVWGPGAAARLADAGLAPRPRAAGWETFPDPVREALGRRGEPGPQALEAARVLARRGRLDAATQMLVDLDQLDALADLLAQQRADALLDIGLVRLKVLLDRLGEARLDARPGLLLQVAQAAETRDDPLRRDCLTRAAAQPADDAASARQRRAVLAEQAADAVRFGDSATGARLAADVLAAVTAGEPLTRARALTASAIAHILTADSTRRLEVRPLLEEAAELYRLAGDARREADALRRLGYTVEYHAGSAARGAELLGRALGLLDAPDRERALSLTYYAEVLETAGRTDAAESAVREAAAIGERLDDDLARFYAAWAAALLAAHRLDRNAVQEQVTLAERAAAVIAPGDASRFEFLVTLADAYAGMGDRRRADEMLARARADAGDIDRATAIAMVDARMAAIWGDPFAAIGQLDAIENTPRSVPHQRWVRVLERAIAVHRQGDQGRAAELLAEVLRMTTALGVPDLAQRIEPWLVAQLDDVGPATDAAAPAMRITLFGRTSVAGPAGDLTPPPGLPRALLALVASRRSIPADEAIELLWPGSDATTGRSRLRNLLNRLRDRSGSVIERHGGLLALAGGVEVDVLTYERLADEALGAEEAARVGLARHALSYWHGEPFEEHRYEPWAASRRERLRRRQLALLDVVIDADLAAGRLDEAIRHIESALAVDPLDEDRHVALVAALSQQGRRTAAHAALSHAIDVVAELGVAPSAALAHWQRRLDQPPGQAVD